MTSKEKEGPSPHCYLNPLSLGATLNPGMPFCRNTVASQVR